MKDFDCTELNSKKDEDFIESVLKELSQGDYSCWDSACRLGGYGNKLEDGEENII